jgi:hypothetical protein
MIKSNEDLIENKKSSFFVGFRYIMAGLSTGCLIVFNVNFNTFNQSRRDPAAIIANSTTTIQ